MASTYSSSLKIELIGTGEQVGTWGSTTNTNLGTALEEAITGRAVADFTSDANLTLTITNSNATQVARHLVLNVTSSFGDLTATRDLVLPAIEKPYIVQNNTTGSQSVRVIVASNSVTIPNGKTAYIYNDATDINDAFDYMTDLELGALTVTGDGTFSGTGQIKVPEGTTAQRSGSPAAGMLRYNSDLSSFEGYDGSIWGGIGGAQAGGAIVTNKDTASVSYTIASGENGLSVGPVTVDTGITITVESGQRWLVL